MSAQEDRVLLEKPLEMSVPTSESSDSSTCGCRGRRAGFHLKTLYLFTKSDIKTVLVPQIIFLVAAVLGHETLTTVQKPTAFEALQRLPLSVFWIWMNLIVCGISNQRLPESVLEDELNKPWRPIAAKRLTPDQAQKLLLTIIPLVMGMSLFVGGFTPSVTMMALLWTYNDLDGSSINIWSRNLINTGGIMCFSAGSLEVISGGQLLPKAWIWIGLTGAAIATTVQALDFPDMEGDRARGRKTIPLVYGEKASRAGLAVAVLMWSAVSPYFWSLSLVGWVVPMGFGSVMAVLTVARRDEKCDKIVAKLWCLWMSTLYVLPLFVA